MKISATDNTANKLQHANKMPTAKLKWQKIAYMPMY